MEFKRMSAWYRHVQFAVLIDDYVAAIREFKLKAFPATIAFRGNSQIEFEKIEDMASPLFACLERDDLKTICYHNCFVYFGRPTDDQFTKFEAFTDIPTMWIPGNSAFARGLAVQDGAWIIISGRRTEYAEVNISRKYEEIKQFNRKGHKARLFTAVPDWTFSSGIAAAKRNAGQVLAIVNPLELLKKLPWDFIQTLAFPFFIILVFFLPSCLRFF
jgi:hypothetical protein